MPTEPILINDMNELTDTDVKLLRSYEGDGSDFIPIEHTSRGVIFNFTKDQLGAIAVCGRYALTPGAAYKLSQDLRNRGN
jgi:hypothetical protein